MKRALTVGVLLRASAAAAAVPVVVATSGGNLHAQALEQQEIVSPVGGSGNLGTGIAADGDVLVAGASYESSGGTGAGAALVYRRDATTGEWLFEQMLLASDAEDYAGFGWAVAIERDVIVVGAPSKDENSTTDTGAAYVFRWDPTSAAWLEEQKLVPATAAGFDLLGTSVALSGDRIVAGAPFRSTDAGPYAGSAFLFRYQDATVRWVEEIELIDPDGAMDDNAGWDVAIDGTTVAVASPWSNEDSTGGAGSIGVWEPSGSTWAQTQELLPSLTSASSFGLSVALRGDELLAGAPFENYSSTIFHSGAAYLFRRSGGSFGEMHRFLPPSPASGVLFGFDVAIRGDLVAIGAPYENAFGITDAGSVWLFRRRNSRRPWVADQELAASGAEVDEFLGRRVAILPDAVLGAAPEANTTSGANSGAVCVYAAAEITLRITPGDPAPGAAVDLAVFRGDPGAAFMIVIEDVSGTPLFLPLLLDVFGADHAQAYQVAAPNPAFGLTVGLRAYKASPTGPIVVSDFAYVDV